MKKVLSDMQQGQYTSVVAIASRDLLRAQKAAAALGIPTAITLVAIVLGCASAAWAAAPGTLTTLRSIAALSNEQASQRLPVSFEGRGWRGFHHHATLSIAAYGFLVAERCRFSPSARNGHLGLSAPKLLPGFRPRGAHPAPAA